MRNDRITKKYNELFPDGKKETSISKELKRMENDSDVNKLRELFCKKLVHKMTAGDFDCTNKRSMRKHALFPVYEENVKRLPESYSFQWMFYSLYIEDDENLYFYFDRFIKTFRNSGKKATESFIVDNLIIPLKDATPKFWKLAQKEISPICIDKGTSKLCKLMGEYFAAETYEETIDILLAYHKKYPDIVVAREYLAHAYDELKKWDEELTYLEGITTTSFYADCMECYYFDLAWVYGKLGDHIKEEEYYRNSISIRSDKEFANNNLGWCLLKQKRYDEAEKLFSSCINKRLDIPNSSHGYIEALIKKGNNVKAKEFVKKGKYEVSMAYKRRVESLPDENTGSAVTAIGKSAISKSSSLSKRKHVKRMQFSSEKALEDELTAKLEAGALVFGKKLKIYRKRGKYGRQYRTSAGVIDLLCEDYKGDLYVIELKKNAGYKDAYDQILRYIDFLSKEKEFKNKSIYGIICLNSPSTALVRKVRKDDRVRLYEYYIDYSEIK